MIDFIIINVRPDTEDFSELIAGFDQTNANILYNPSRSEVRHLLRESRNDLVLFGHGDDRGLYNTMMNGYIVGSGDVDMLRQRNVIGLWCFAGNFGDRYGLHGFFTSMFISNVDEAHWYDYDPTEQQVTDENYIFARRINTFLHNNTPYSQWVDILQSECHSDIPFVRFNYEAMAYYK